MEACCAVDFMWPAADQDFERQLASYDHKPCFPPHMSNPALSTLLKLTLRIAISVIP
jgi:hypothetical protein